jgi:acyl-CoA oxidase
VAGGAGSATQKALAPAIRYGATRRQFSNPATGEEVVVLDYLAHQRKLLPALATSYALHFAQEELVTRMHELQQPGATPDEAAQRELETRAAGVKAVGTWHATRTIQTARRRVRHAQLVRTHEARECGVDGAPASPVTWTGVSGQAILSG